MAKRVNWPAPSLGRLSLATLRVARLLVVSVLAEVLQDPRSLYLAPETPERLLYVLAITDLNFSQ